jgi:uncharacterized protein YndB with AHSA1/START domain
MNTPNPPTKTLVIEKDMKHSPEKIWRALTQAPLIGQWLMENDFCAQVGHKFTLRSKPAPNWNGVIDCEVLAVETNQRLSYTWASMGLASVVTWTLTPGDGGTHVRMEQSGFPSDDSPYYKGASYGWQGFIGKLEQVVEGVN